MTTPAAESIELESLESLVHHCASCRVRPHGGIQWRFCCRECYQELGGALAKALGDPFDYAVGLRSGAVIRFETAERHGDWITLKGSGQHWDTPIESDQIPYYCPRGIDVRLDDIIWAADAPEGS